MEAAIDNALQAMQSDQSDQAPTEVSKWPDSVPVMNPTPNFSGSLTLTPDYRLLAGQGKLKMVERTLPTSQMAQILPMPPDIPSWNQEAIEDTLERNFLTDFRRLQKPLDLQWDSSHEISAHLRKKEVMLGMMVPPHLAPKPPPELDRNPKTGEILGIIHHGPNSKEGSGVETGLNKEYIRFLPERDEINVGPQGFGPHLPALAVEGSLADLEDGVSENPTSLNRPFKNPRDLVRGVPGGMPFTPGGMGDLHAKRTQRLQQSRYGLLDNGVAFLPERAKDERSSLEHRAKAFRDLDHSERQMVPPGLSHGMSFIDGGSEGRKAVEAAETSAIEHSHRATSGRPKAEYVNIDFDEDDLDLLDAEDAIEDGGIGLSPTVKAAAGELGPDARPMISVSEERHEHRDDGQIGDEVLEAMILDGSPKHLKTSTSKRKYSVVVDATIEPQDFEKKVPVLARRFPFKLDPFQKQAVLRMEEGETVFVAAHTSAGKTVVAEYAIALSQKHLRRAIYTSPIKALSNQKFHDFRQTFGEKEVGILTGDVQINAEGSCLVMTTEILRSMLYRGADLIRDVEWVIFDEVHYINDPERGVVWEEVIIMLPQHINIVLLSATVPNTIEFAEWIGRTKQRKVHVISTLKRPVPLAHYLYAGNDPKSKDTFYLLVDTQGRFLENGYKEAKDAVNRDPMVQITSSKDKGATAASQQRGRGGQQRVMRKDTYGPKGGKTMGGNTRTDRMIYASLIESLRKRELLPMVIFTFSRRKVEGNARGLSSLDLTTATEKAEIHRFATRCLSRLKESDRKLPQVLSVLDMLSRGIAVHHSGLLPILREIVEILFGRGIIRVLFATETFAMGVNMPAKTVCFDAIRKHDGTAMRELLPSEYIQMAGRAGRRGLDTFGTVLIICKDEVPEANILYQMLMGKPTLLTSQFRLTYNMILNLLRVEEMRIEDVMRRSFSEAALQKSTPEAEADAQHIKHNLRSLGVLDCPICRGGVEDFADSEIMRCVSYESIARQAGAFVHRTLHTSPGGQKILATGRIVVVAGKDHRNVVGCLVATKNQGQMLDVLLHITDDEHNTLRNGGNIHMILGLTSPADANPSIAVSTAGNYDYALPLQQPRMVVGGVSAGQLTLSSIDISDVGFLAAGDRVHGDIVAAVEAAKILNTAKSPSLSSNESPEDCAALLSKQQRIARAQVLEALQRFTEDPQAEVNPSADYKIQDLDVVQEFTHRTEALARAKTLPCTELCPQFIDHYRYASSVYYLNVALQHRRNALSDDALTMLPDYQARLAVLRRLRYIDERGTVAMKGRVACEMNTCDEVLVTELIYEGLFAELAPEDMVALLSCFVNQNKSQSLLVVPEHLNTKLAAIQSTATRVGEVQYDYGLPLASDTYVKTVINASLVEVVYEWAKGVPFSELTQLTDIQEGSVVRTIVRLNETCRDLRNAARVIGEPDLYKRAEEAANLIKRDIVFAPSLYTTLPLAGTGSKKIDGSNDDDRI
eukprot:Clim_evm7s60 gene=Clim_evmTU7s60